MRTHNSAGKECSYNLSRASGTSSNHNTDILSRQELAVGNVLANRLLFTHPANTEQHYHSFLVVFVSLSPIFTPPFSSVFGLHHLPREISGREAAERSVVVTCFSLWRRLSAGQVAFRGCGLETAAGCCCRRLMRAERLKQNNKVAGCKIKTILWETELRGAAESDGSLGFCQYEQPRAYNMDAFLIQEYRWVQLYVISLNVLSKSVRGLWFIPFPAPAPRVLNRTELEEVAAELLWSSL